jgi:predicted DNA-binding antitoxin AbrB/MazE fold protein
MGKTIRAKFSNGVIEPLEKLEIPEGKEVTVTIIGISSAPTSDSFKRAAGGWSGTINADELIESIYRDRAILTREAPLV